jgi:hypothetical protein
MDLRTISNPIPFVFKFVENVIKRGNSCEQAREDSWVNECMGHNLGTWSQSQIDAWARQYVSQRGGSLSHVTMILRCGFGPRQHATPYPGNSPTYSPRPAPAPSPVPAPTAPPAAEGGLPGWALPLGAAVIAVMLLRR